MTNRRSFLRNLIAAAVLSPVVAPFLAFWSRKPRFRSVFRIAAKPVDPSLGFVVIHRRMDT